jgi:hypothetical protein
LDKDALIQQIEHAFADVARPSDDALLAHPYNVDNGEAMRLFGGKRSQDIVDVTMHASVSCYEEIEALTPSGIHYFLPCYLRYVIDEPEANRGHFCLIAGLAPFLAQFHGDHSSDYPGLNSAQREAVAQTLQFMLTHLTRYDLAPYEATTRSELVQELEYWSDGRGLHPAV